MSTDYKEVRGKRGLFGKLLVGAFWLYQVGMVALLFSYWADVGEQAQGMSEAGQAGAAIGATLGTGTIFFFWVGGTVILGIIVLISRPAKTWQAVERAVLLAALTGAAAAATPESASAQEQAPDYDVDAYCKQVAQTGGGSYVIEKGCREQEQSARRWVESADISAQIVDYCDQVASTTGGSYMIFQGCVQQERQARDAMQ